jgi:hypothetical protein
MSDGLFCMPRDRVAPLDLPMAQAMMGEQGMGLGSGESLRKARLVFPE